MLLAPDSVRQSLAWLTGDECHDLDDVAFIAGLGGHLRAVGLPVDRLTLHLRRLHPEFLGRTVAWSPGAAVEITDRAHGTNRQAQFVRSPIRHVMDTHEWLTVRADDPRFPDWAEFDVFRNQGLREMVVAPLLHGAAPASAAAFATRRPDGFTDADRQVLRAIASALRTACEVRLLRHVESTLLDTYVGTATGRRILAGHIQRGDVEALEAALFLCDLRGFTALSDRLPGEEVLALLSLYFDQVVPAVEAAGGEILKFMGDAVLAYFHAAGDPGQSCRAAFEAAQTALKHLAELSTPPGRLRAGISLHYGTVAYGNIGSGHRLDFTVIGRDVNLTSRLQGLCEVTGRPIVMSRRFAELLDRPGVASIGGHLVKGLADPVDVFAPLSAAGVSAG
jgi:adenylate cyclase